MYGGELTTGSVHGKLDIGALVERARSQRFRDKLGSYLARNIAAGVVYGELVLVQDGLGGDESGQKTTDKVGELHDDEKGC